MKISEPHFYIIYTPGTVRLLMGLASTLLKWSKAEFTLVSNGCAADEQNSLQQFCTKNSRLHYRSLTTEAVMPHGAALNVLQSQNSYADFGFIDSDIYAVEEFDTPFTDLSNSDMVCQFIPAPASFRLPNEINKLKKNCLGCSYFMRYDNAVISKLRGEFDIHFDKYQWQTVPPSVQKMIEGAGFKQAKFDTARLINAILLAKGDKLVALDDRSIRHLGGVSRIKLQRQRRVGPLLGFLIRFIPSRVLRNSLVNIALDRHQIKPLNVNNAITDKHARKRLVNHYFHDLLMQLTPPEGVININQLPALPHSGYPSIDQYVNQITNELIILFEALNIQKRQALSDAVNDENE